MLHACAAVLNLHTHTHIELCQQKEASNISAFLFSSLSGSSAEAEAAFLSSTIPSTHSPFPLQVRNPMNKPKSLLLFTSHTKEKRVLGAKSHVFTTFSFLKGCLAKVAMG